MRALTWHGKGSVRCTCQILQLSIFGTRSSKSRPVRSADQLHFFDGVMPAEGPELYMTFRGKKDGCTKVVIRPNG
jgi:hypothetical protein